MNSGPIGVLHLEQVEHVLDSAFVTLVDERGGEVRQLLQVALATPLRLHQLLRELHRGQRGGEPPLRGEHVHTGLQQTLRLQIILPLLYILFS